MPRQNSAIIHTVAQPARYLPQQFAGFDEANHMIDAHEAIEIDEENRSHAVHRRPRRQRPAHLFEEQVAICQAGQLIVVREPADVVFAREIFAPGRSAQLA